jgi:hypothetical protein
MDEIKKAFRSGADTARKAARDSDGHTTGDDVADVGDAVRTDVANAGDDLRRGVKDAKREMDRPAPR